MSLRYHFVRERVALGMVELKYCPTKDMIANIFTKPLAKEQFDKLRKGLVQLSN
jgi:hypothetical protein